MSERDGSETVAVEVPPETKELLEEQDGYQWENVTKAIHGTFGGGELETPEQVRREIEHEEQKRRNKIERRNELGSEITRHEQRIDQLKERLAEMQDTQGERVADLDDLLDDLVAGNLTRVWDDHGDVVELARKYYNGKHDGPMVIADLKERAEERELGLSENRFKDKYEGI